MYENTFPMGLTVFIAYRIRLKRLWRVWIHILPGSWYFTRLRGGVVIPQSTLHRPMSSSVHQGVLALTHSLCVTN